MLAMLRHDQRLCDMAGGNDMSASTVRRWLLEVIDLGKRPLADSRILVDLLPSGAPLLCPEIIWRITRLWRAAP
ncbi:hypothetical protein ACFWOG_37070 [Kitasatospora sp. NPDC058406]|uniref:hypothetical protein n=1 Tax=Kitasatospora sp. NPDC058406 TaxID=3346483 RepID=UPI003647F6DB